MKPAGLILLVPAGFALISFAAETEAKPAATTPPTLSQRLKQEIAAKLPAFVPPPANPVVSRTPPPADADADVLVLPKVTVQERRQPRIDPNDMLTTQALDEKLAKEFLDSLKGLDAILNGFSIPLLSPSLAARGRALHKARKLEDLNHTIEAIKQVDPKTSAELQKAVNDMQRAEDWQDRVTGGK